MMLTVIKMFYKILKRKPFFNEAFMVDIQNRFFQLIILQQLLVKLFDKKKAKSTLIEKKPVSKEGQEEIV